MKMNDDCFTLPIYVWLAISALEPFNEISAPHGLAHLSLPDDIVLLDSVVPPRKQTLLRRKSWNMTDAKVHLALQQQELNMSSVAQCVGVGSVDAGTASWPMKK
jgi:hypothetical protein